MDDLSANREALVALLHDQGHRLTQASDGREGLAAVQAERPDLVITDVMMPGMDGYEFVRQLRLDAATLDLPVLFATTHYGDREARAVAPAYGVADVLTKPVASADLLRVVGAALSTKATFTAVHDRLLAEQHTEKAGDLRTANARLRALIAISLELASEPDPDQLLQHVCDAARDLFGASYITLGIVDLQHRTVQKVVSCGLTDVGWVKPGDPINGIFGTVVADRRSVRGWAPAADPAGPQFPAHHPDVQAYVTAPVASPHQVYGWFCLVGNEGRPFTEDDETLVTSLAGQIGRIYESSHFRRVAERRTADLEREVADRQQAEAALEAAGVGIWDMDYPTGTLRWSAILEAQYGLAPGTFPGTFAAFVALVHPLDRDAFLEALASAVGGGSFSVQHRVIWPDGTERWLSGSGRIHLGPRGEPLRGIGISMDVTARYALEAQYRQAQKMEAIGRLAGGLAHDFNNLLTAIFGYCELLLADFAPGDAHFADITEIQRAGETAAALTRQLLAFSRKQIVEPAVLDLNIVVGEMRALLSRMIREDVRVVLALRPGLHLVKADRAQLEQIVMNLAVNARDAMPKGGTLTIETANTELDTDYATSHLAVIPGRFVVLTVSDTGTGMTPQVQARLFEPFFTTKEPGHGTGLGLATVHGIVTAAGGSVNVYSELGQGTSIKVYFPVADPVEAVVVAAPPAPRPRAATETVLVVEDADELRTLIRRVLERQGYTVLVAGDADEAVKLFAGDTSIDVLLTDVVMPGASGPELTRQLVAQRPGLKVIYMSGYTEDAIVQHGVLSPGVAFLHKPFTSDTLGRKIREALDR